MMTSTLATKLLALGFTTALGAGTLAIGAPDATAELVTAGAPSSVAASPGWSRHQGRDIDEELDASELEENERGGDIDLDEDEDLDGVRRGRSAEAHARRDARTNERGRSAEAHARRDPRTNERGRSAEGHARRDARIAVRGARRAILAARPSPGNGPRGLSPEAREALRELRPAHRAD